MIYPKFFDLTDNGTTTPLQFCAIEPSVKIPGTQYSGDRLLQGDYRKLTFPIKCEYQLGRYPRDLLGTGSSLYLLSTTFLKLLKKHKLTGWQSYEVDLPYKGAKLKGYHGLSVTGRCGPSIYLKDTLVQRYTDDSGVPWRASYQGMFFDPLDWDGSDFCLISGRGGYVLVSERAARLIQQAKLTNVCLYPTEEMVSAADYEEGFWGRQYIRPRIIPATDTEGFYRFDHLWVRNRNVTESDYKHLVELELPQFAEEVGYVAKGVKETRKTFGPSPRRLEGVPKPERLDHQRLYRGDYKEIALPVKAVVKHGSVFSDVIDVGFRRMHFISDRFKSVLEKHQLTGWETYPVEIVDGNGKAIAGYHGLAITGRAGKAIYKRGTIFEAKRLFGGTSYKGMFFNREEWDGSDFFMLKDGEDIIVTPRTHRILLQEGLTNISLESISSIVRRADFIDADADVLIDGPTNTMLQSNMEVLPPYPIRPSTTEKPLDDKPQNHTDKSWWSRIVGTKEE